MLFNFQGPNSSRSRDRNSFILPHLQALVNHFFSWPPFRLSSVAPPLLRQLNAAIIMSTLFLLFFSFFRQCPFSAVVRPHLPALCYHTANRLCRHPCAYQQQNCSQQFHGGTSFPAAPMASRWVCLTGVSSIVIIWFTPEPHT